MEDYRLEQSGQEVQNILNTSTTQSDLDAEILRAGQAEQALDGKIDEEEIRAKAAEKQNADDIDEEELARQQADQTLDGKIGDEEIRAKAAEKQNADDIDALEAAIQAILLLIPSAATSLNQLADKSYVDSSIATATATFRGTYNLVSDLNLMVSATHAQIATALGGAVSGEDNNDYAFVQIPTSDATPTQIAKTERYKFNGTTWEYEYDLNNSGYTADQWAAINSGITAALVSKLSALPTNAELTTALGLLSDGIATINGKIPSEATTSNKLVDTAAMQSYITQILGTISATFNVASADGHVAVQITQVNGVITNVSVTTNDIASAAALTLVTGRVTDAEANIVSLGGRMTTAETDIDDLQQLYNNLQQSAPVVIEPTDTWPVAVADRSATVIYRVVDRVNTPPQYYSDYMFRASDLSGQPVLMAKYDNAIDPRPKKGSKNLVTSGGVFDNMGALDVSELNATENPHTLATYADLSAALAAIPSDYQKGGMSIKFVQSSDNKYVQFRCISDEFTTDVTKWAICVNNELIENPEWAVVFTAKNEGILFGSKTDGHFYFGAGCPPQIKDLLEKYVDLDTLTVLLNEKVDKVPGKSLINSEVANSQYVIEDFEWMKILMEHSGKILEGRKVDGTKVEYTDVEYPNGIPSDIKEHIDTEIEETKNNIESAFIIENPYAGITSKVRHCAISHEHIKTQAQLEKAVNDGVDIICISNYTPGVPYYPLQGFSGTYLEWEFVKDGNGNLMYEKYPDGTTKTFIAKDGNEYKMPVLNKVFKTLTGSFSDFTKENGQECVIANLVQLPNAEHTQQDIGGGYSGGHINFIGTTWSDAVNGNPSDTVLADDIAQYNQENSYNFTMSSFHTIFTLWKLQDMLCHVEHDWLRGQKVFGTINHPGFTGTRDWQVDEFMKAASLFKGMEIYNNSENPTDAEYSIAFYDRTLLRGYKFWCLAVDDWGNPNHEYNPNNPDRRGCNLMYLPSDYESKSMAGKQEAVLDAYINGSFAATGYGTLDLSNVVVDEDGITVTFNQVPDTTYIVIDGVRTASGALQTLHAMVNKKNIYVRFEAYKDDDFIFTQPFYIKKNNL